MIQVITKRVSAHEAAKLTDGAFVRYASKNALVEEFYEDGELVSRRITREGHYPRVHNRYRPVEDKYVLKQDMRHTYIHYTRGTLNVHSQWAYRGRRVREVYITRQKRTVAKEFFGNGVVHRQQSTRVKKSMEWTPRYGPFREYYKNGNPRVSTYYRLSRKNGTPVLASAAHGVSTTYESNGNPRERTTLRRGIKHGWQVFFGGGRVSVLRRFKNGQLAYLPDPRMQDELTHKDKLLVDELVQGGVSWDAFYGALTSRGIDPLLVRQVYQQLKRDHDYILGPLYGQLR